MGSVTGQGTEIPHVPWWGQNKKTDEIKPETQHLFKKCIVKVFDNLPSKKQININGAGCFVGTWQDIVLMIDFMPW